MSRLFTVEVADGGAFECTTPAPKVYLLSFSSPADNRLTTSFIDAWLLALEIIEQRHPRGVVITTSSIPKFYSNGLDLAHVSETPGFIPSSLYALFRKLLTYPMPTIALLNGHGFAAGFMAAMYHDYRIMNPEKGYLCLNEVLFGAVMTAGMVSVYRQKLRGPQTFRALVLEAKRFGGPEALEHGIVDLLGGVQETLQFIERHKLATMGDSGVYGKLKQEMWRETLQILDTHDSDLARNDRLEAEEDRRQDAAKARVTDWEKNGGKAKL